MSGNERQSTINGTTSVFGLSPSLRLAPTDTSFWNPGRIAWMRCNWMNGPTSNSIPKLRISCGIKNSQRISQHLPGPPRFSQQQSLGIYWLRKSKYPTCWSILSSISSGYIQLWFITPSFNDVKSHFMYLDQLNHTNSTTHPSMNNGTATINKLNVDTPVISPTTPLVQNCNSTILTLQPSQCAICGQSSQHIPKDAHNV